MPRIRKKTSKRGTTHKRARVKHKVAESRKKAKKETKKNTQWKSKHKQDPGIPNNFPYKDQILAEVAEQRRQDEEAKQRRKDEKKAKKAATADASTEDSAPVYDGISSLVTSTIVPATKATSEQKSRAMQPQEDEDEAPVLLDSEFPNMQAVLEKADVVLNVLDARDPLAYQSQHLQEALKGCGRSKTILVLNKIDLCPKEVLQSWLLSSRQQQPTYLFRSASAFLPEQEDKGKSGNKSSSSARSKKDAVGVEPLLKALSEEATSKPDSTLIVAVIGIANTGKSSLINSLLKQSACPTYKLTSAPPGPSTTERAQEIVLERNGTKIRFIDTPALFWITPETQSEEQATSLRGKDVLLRNKGRIDRLKDPLPPVARIVSRAEPEDLMLLYNLPAFGKGDVTAFLTALARVNNMIKKGGIPDLLAAARIVLRDWSVNKLPWFTAPVSPPKISEPNAALLNADDLAALEAAPTRKEMRLGTGIVRLAPGEIERRLVALDQNWGEDDDPSEVSDDDGNEDDEDQLEAPVDDVDFDSDVDEDEEEEEGNEDVDVEDASEDEVSPPKGKRKRQEKVAPAPIPKKVAFVQPPKSSKRSRPSAPPKAHSKPSKAGRKSRR